MKSLLALAATASLSLVSATANFQSVKSPTINDGDTIPGAYFVELDQPSTVHGRRWNNTAHHALYSSLDKCGAKWSLREEFNSPGLFVGATVNLESEKDLAILADIPHVAKIFPIYLYRAPQPTESRDLVLDTGYAFDTFAPHVMTGVDKLHAQGYLGAGIRIALLDSGVDYRHPALGGNIGPGFKFTNQYDFSKDKPTTLVDVPDCRGHGTHVSGIIGADPYSHKVTGVAPKATFAMYKLHNCEEHFDDETVVKALDAARKKKYDVISMSIGNPGLSWTQSASALAASRIAAEGVVVVAAAGNEGAQGPFYVGTPGAGNGVIGVASIENTDILVQKVELDNTHEPIQYFSADPLPIETDFPICALSNDIKADKEACSPLPTSTDNLGECVVIVRDGGCTLAEKAANLMEYGAQYALFYSTGATPRYDNTPGFISAMISQVDGEYLRGMAALEPQVRLTFPQDQPPTIIPNPVAGLTAASSSYGPTWDLDFKPSVAAPGTRILSTLPLQNGVAAYGMKSGTSMATPLVAGVAALLLEKHGKTKSNALGMRYLLESTAKTVKSSKKSGDPLQTVVKAGAGMLDAYKAMYGKTIVTPGEILLNDTAYHKAKHTITIKNTSKKIQEYNITHVPAGTMNAFDSNGKAMHGPAPLNNHYAEISIQPNKRKIKPGQSATFVATFTQPKGVDAKKFPVYSGFLKVASESESVHVSYMGVAATMKNLKVLDRTSDYFTAAVPFVVGADKTIEKGLATNGQNVNNAKKTFGWKSDKDYPVLYYRLLAGSPLVRVDLVDSSYKLTTPLSKAPIKNRLRTSRYTSRNTDGTLEKNGYEVLKLDKKTYASGKNKIPDGNYKILVRALRITGNPNKDSDYDVWLSPEFAIKQN